jgi:hypothetical protein
MEEIREIRLAKFKVWRNNLWVTVRLAEIRQGEVFVTNNNKLDGKYLVALGNSYLGAKQVWEIRARVYDDFERATGK